MPLLDLGSFGVDALFAEAHRPIEPQKHNRHLSLFHSVPMLQVQVLSRHMMLGQPAALFLLSSSFMVFPILALGVTELALFCVGPALSAGGPCPCSNPLSLATS